ncbi:MAG: 6-bladed beta-propeller [Prevotellaceae bacterium]|jgi:hypothetical protein|nr:6-bladed beta-propeller [Prevotellaceae bacterium]
MKKIELFYFIAGLIALASCSREKVNTLVEIHIDPSQVESAYDIAGDIESEWDIIALETTDNYLISAINKLYYQNGIYYLLDKNGHTVFLYDSSGKAISKLYKKGEGPDEYSMIEALAIVDKNIWVSDSNLRSLICYDENLKMTDRYKTFDIMSVYDMVTIDGNICVAANWSGWNDQNIECGIYNTANREITGFLHVPKQKEEIATFKKTNQLAGSENSCLFIHSYCDTIFQLSNNEFSPAYKAVFKERYEDIPLPIEKIMEPSLAHIIRGMENIKQTSQNIFISYLDTRKFMTAMYNKSKGVCRVYHYLINSNIGALPIFLYNAFFDENNIISVHEASEVLDFFGNESNLAKIKNESDRKKIETIMSSIDPYSNPVLIRYKLKPNSSL